MKVGVQVVDATKAAVDVLAIGVFEGDLTLNDSAREVDDALGKAISQLIEAGEIKGKSDEVTTLFSYGKIAAKHVAVFGLGEQEKFDHAAYRKVAASVVKTANSLKVETAGVLPVQISNPHPDTSAESGVQAFAEGLVLAGYHFEGYKLNKEEKKILSRVDFIGSSESGPLLKVIEDGVTYAQATNFARDLGNTPGNRMTPTVLAERAADLAKRHGMESEILGPEELQQLGMEALLAVAKGSAEPPRMIVIKYQGRETWDDVIGYVGKGITFDSGGISIKPAQNMEDMKFDMMGGAAVLGAMEAIGRLRPRVNIVAVVSATENMPSGSAYKPGDVIGSFSGKTIEVHNTDAEGRIVLADAVAYAKHLGASRIIDLATLTGAVIVALGNQATGALTNDEAFFESFQEAACEAGERVWQLPSYDEYKELLKSDIADIKNIGGRGAGTITGGLFIGHFVEETPWIHLDIAGTGWTHEPLPLSPKGATGVMVRSLVNYAEKEGRK